MTRFSEDKNGRPTVGPIVKPVLDDIANVVGLSPSHFQRLFVDWAGVSPKKFIQYLSLDYSKKLLKENQASLLDAAYETGLSSTSRLHDLFINIESMTPGDYKKGGENLSINYSYVSSIFGKIIIASTDIGICHIMFDENEGAGLNNLKSKFPNAHYHHRTDKFQVKAIDFFDSDWNETEHMGTEQRALGSSRHPRRADPAESERPSLQRPHRLCRRGNLVDPLDVRVRSSRRSVVTHESAFPEILGILRP